MISAEPVNPAEFAALGVWAGPAGALVLPPATGDATRVARGDLSDLPAAWQFLAQAVEGDFDHAAHNLPEGNEPEHLLNHFVLTGGVFPANLPGDLNAIATCAAFQSGEAQSVPEVNAGWDVHVQAYVHATRAFAAREQGQLAQASHALEQAIHLLATVDAPIFRSRLQAERASLLDGPEGVALLKAAISDAAVHPDSLYQAELQLQLGMAAQAASDGRPTFLKDAVGAYQAALRHFSRTEHPQAYALAQMNLGLTYLAMPMNDEAARVRPAVALTCLREARDTLNARRNEFPEDWAATTVNLANALVYAPSVHREDNLWEAVSLYEEALAVPRDRLSRARALANQGNALAHLGAFSRALPRLNEARDLFASQQEPEAAATVQAMLDDLQSHQAAQETSK